MPKTPEPTKPEVPKLPENTEVPNPPENSEVPKTPEKTEMPQIPEENSEIPEEKSEPEPQKSEIPELPKSPENPEKCEISEPSELTSSAKAAEICESEDAVEAKLPASIGVSVAGEETSEIPLEQRCTESTEEITEDSSTLEEQKSELWRNESLDILKDCREGKFLGINSLHYVR